MTEQCNGWTNYPTWAINLWADEYNDLDGMVQAAADMERDSRALRSWVEDHIVYPMDHVIPPASCGQDLLSWALDMVDWHELREHYDPVLYARERGRDNGRAAASWAFDGNTDAATYRATLRGIEDVDPAILDALPSADLSGQWADTLTGPELFKDACESVGVDPDAEPYADWFSDICDAYEQAFNDACTDEIVRVARFHLDAECPLADDWRAWPADKQADRLFMNCPACGAYGSHVGSS